MEVLWFCWKISITMLWEVMGSCKWRDAPRCLNFKSSLTSSMNDSCDKMHRRMFGTCNMIRRKASRSVCIEYWASTCGAQSHVLRCTLKGQNTLVPDTFFDSAICLGIPWSRSFLEFFQKIVLGKLSPLHNVYFVKYDVTVSFLALVLDTATYFVPQVSDTAS